MIENEIKYHVSTIVFMYSSLTDLLFQYKIGIPIIYYDH